MNACFKPKLNGNKLVLRIVLTQKEVTQRAITQRSMKQIRVTQVDITQAGPAPRGINQVGVKQRDIEQRGIKQVGQRQIAITQEGITERGIKQVDVTQVGITQADITQRGVTHKAITQRGIMLVGITQRSITQVCITLLGITQVSITLLDITQVRIMLLGITQVSITFQGVTQVSITLLGITKVSITLVCITQRGNASTKRVNNFNDSCRTKDTNAYKNKQLENAAVSEQNNNQNNVITNLSFSGSFQMKGGHSYPGEPRTSIFHKHYNTIGEFYEEILDAFNFLTNHGKSQEIFTGDKSKQLELDFHFGRYGRLFRVTDFESAKQAIKEIIREGEGSSPCNPLDWSHNKGDLSHYFLFKSIVERHKIKVYNEKGDSDSESMHFFSVSFF